MRIWAMVTALSATMASASLANEVAAPPPVVPYLCSGGEIANVIYESGSDYLHAAARLTLGDRHLELHPAPTLYGFRYRTRSSGEGAYAWTVRGEQASLTESPDADGYVRGEREITRCIRLRGALPQTRPAHH